MANRLRMAQVNAIQVLRDQGWSQREIAEQLGIHRDTVARYVRLARAGPDTGHSDGPSKPAKVITGSDGENPRHKASRAGRPNPPAARLSSTLSAQTEGSSPKSGAAPVITGQNRSRCAAFRELIEAKCLQGLSTQRIWQDLRDEHGFEDG